jgi:excisionase family DNA binding protein
MADNAGRDGHWLSLAEAAAVLGVSVRTLRRRVTSGEIQRRRTDGRVLFFVPWAATVATDAVTVAQTMAEEAATMHPAVTALERALAAERERASQAEQAAAMYQERARGLEQEVERLSAQLALPAPAPAPAPRPWWQRWRRG